MDFRLVQRMQAMDVSKTATVTKPGPVIVPGKATTKGSPYTAVQHNSENKFFSK